MSRGIILDCDLLPEKKSLVDEFDDLELDQPMSFNDFRPSEKKKNKTTEEISNAVDDDTDDWGDILQQFKAPKVKASGSNYRKSDVYDFLHGGGKKKKKKKKEAEGPKDYSHEFEAEMGLYQNLLKDSTAFTDSLQKRYYSLESSKSSARGIGKFTTDLISAINQSRDGSIKLISQIASLKKDIINLNMKERKESEAAKGEDGEDLSSFSSSFLKKLIQQDRSDAAIYGDGTPVDGGEEDIFESINDALGDDARDPEIDKLLKYENRNIKLVAYVSRSTNDYEVKAIDPDTGEEIDDYPIQQISHLDINPSTEVASDEYHTKYPIIWTD